MDTEALASLVGPALAGAIADRGFKELTPVQEAVLAPRLRGRDLRVSSQTGSGKTVAIGFILRDVLTGECKAKTGIARPLALVLTPTRELARQVEEELRWLLQPVGARVMVVMGGASYRTENRELAASPAVIVGTPGRLLDHLRRGAIDPSNLKAVVLDEADRMFDMGFREDIEAVFALAPPDRASHLVSATFPREVLALANRVQKDPAFVEGTPLGAANADIEHIVHLVLDHERLAAIVNLLLAAPGEQTLIFARTRANVGDLAQALSEAGFSVRALSGELEQRDRDRAMGAMRRGALDAMVATDVAARGIDVEGISRVIQVEPPTDPDSYVHRSGRTGRAGRKGTSILLVPPQGLTRASLLLRRAGITWRIEPVPTSDVLAKQALDRRFEELTGDGEDPTGAAQELAARILGAGYGQRALARLIASAEGNAPAPRALTRLEAPKPKAPPSRPSARGRAAKAAKETQDWARFKVTWGEVHGADARRILAMICRRGGINRTDVGAIDVRKAFSVVEVAERIANDFAREAGQPDPRDPRVRIVPFEGPPPTRGPGPGPRPRGAGPPRPRGAPAPAPRARPSAGGRQPPKRGR